MRDCISETELLAILDGTLDPLALAHDITGCEGCTARVTQSARRRMAALFEDRGGQVSLIGPLWTSTSAPRAWRLS